MCSSSSPRTSAKAPWKLIQTFDPEGIELYHLTDDRGETKNLAAEQAAKVDAWRKDVGAEMMKPNPDYDPLQRSGFSATLNVMPRDASLPTPIPPAMTQS